MTHFGIICPNAPGHINPMAALGRELQRRGHCVTVLQLPDMEAKVHQEGLGFRPIGHDEYPLGSWATDFEKLGRLQGLESLRFTVRVYQREANFICRDAPTAILKAGIDALLVDQTDTAGGTVADWLGLPFITICNAMAINREASIPPSLTGWSYQNTRWARFRNRVGYRLTDWIIQPMLQVVNGYRRQWKLPIVSSMRDTFSHLAQLSQQPAAFDFPRSVLPECFHYVGPLRNPSPQPIPFPFEQLTGQPLIYASLGTIQNTRQDVFQTIASACAGLDAQLVLSHGGGLSSEAVQQLTGSPLVVSYAPQYELLSRAALTITHAGMNTVLDSLSHGVPLVAIPITHEQPAIAARIRWTETGEVLPLRRLDASALRLAVQRVLQHNSYRTAAEKVKESIRQAGGVVRAADIVEQAVVSRRPVLAQN